MTHTLGIEFGSTRIKAVLIDEAFRPVASGDYTMSQHKCLFFLFSKLFCKFFSLLFNTKRLCL